MHRTQAQRDAAGAVFGEPDVAKSYRARPPYAPAMIQRLACLPPRRRRVLDLGCGPGTLAIPLAEAFEEVVALDPSAAMLAEGQAIDAGRHSNLRWTEGRAESFDGAGGFDLVVAGTSIHWPDHAVLFPRLAAWTDCLAVVGNADLELPCGEPAGRPFLERWLATMAERTPGVRHPYDPAAFAAETCRHELWMDVAGRERFAHVHHQSLADYIEAQHSTATFSREVMGDALAARYDRELAELMAPWVAADGQIALRYVSTLTWGAPRSSPRAAETA